MAGDFPKCLTCGAFLVVNGYYSIGYCPGQCLDTCLKHNATISSPDGLPAECPICREIRIEKEKQIEERLWHLAAIAQMEGGTVEHIAMRRAHPNG